MKYLSLILVSILCLTSISCDSLDDTGIEPDPLITGEIADEETYDLVTPVYGMKVSIDKRVGRSDQNVLEILDRRAEQFLDCQFEEGSQLGFEETMLSSGTIIPPLSELRVLVVPIRFKCDVPGADVCNGAYFGSFDIAVVAEGGFPGCDVLLPWKHELGHRYGMDSNHTNISEFRACTGSTNCDFDDLIGID